MPKFMCKNCGYQLESENDCKDKMCPYCGEKKLAEEESAETLVGGKNG